MNQDPGKGGGESGPVGAWSGHPAASLKSLQLACQARVSVGPGQRPVIRMSMFLQHETRVQEDGSLQVGSGQRSSLGEVGVRLC